MLWHTEMACGVHLGILLICLVQAEHVRCLWATQAQNSQSQNGNKYVGFSQQDSGPGRLVGSYPQNQLRRASAQSSSFNTDDADSSAYSKGLSSSGYTQTLSQPAKSGSASVRLVHSNSPSKPNWQSSKTSKMNTNQPKKFPGLSTAIASGSSVSQYHKKSGLQQGTQRASKYASSSSASVQSPFSTSKAASHQSAKKAPAQTPAFYGQMGYSPVKSSSRFSESAPLPQKSPVHTQTSATGPARRVFKTSKSPRFTPLQNERTRDGPSQTEAGKHGSKLFPGGAKPAPTSSIVSNHASYSQSLPKKQNIPVGLQPRSQKMLSSQRSSYHPSAEQLLSSTSSLQASWSGRNPPQGARNLPASESSRAGTSGKRYAPTKTYSIPPQFGGFAIRRLKDPDEQKLTIPKPQKTYSPPQQTYPAPTQKPYTAPTQTYASSWQKHPAPTQKPYIAPTQKPYTPTWQKHPAPTQKPYMTPMQQTYAPSGQKHPSPTQKPHTPTWQKLPAPTQKPYIAPTQKPYIAPTQKTYALSWQKQPAPTQKPYVTPMQQTYAPSGQKHTAPSQKPYTAPTQKTDAPSQEPYTAHSQQSESLKPQVPSVHAKSKWMRIKLRNQL